MKNYRAGEIEKKWQKYWDENNTFKITEKIGAYFNIDKHGIFRKIPLKNSIVRNDGTKSNNRAKITNISVDNISLFFVFIFAP